MTRIVSSPSLDSSEWLIELVADCLKVPAEELDAEVPLMRYGLDSLAAVQLTAAIAAELQQEVPEELLLNHPDIASLENFVAAVRDGATTQASSRGHSAAEDCLSAMLADAVLPDDVLPPRVNELASTSPAAVMLSGATGFLGAYLLAALLEQTDKDVVCLVRSRHGSGDLFGRVRGNLERYGVWRPAYSSRVRAVGGDLALPMLGVSNAVYEQLGEDVGAIYHCAAEVNWVLPYASLREANVLGTLEMLRFACHRRPKAFHFVSSLATCYTTVNKEFVLESDDTLLHLPGLHFGYAQSKCVAESLVRSAALRGLPATVIRPGLIVGDRHIGLSAADELLPAMIRGCIRMGTAPDLDWPLACCPVDEVAAATVALTHNLGNSTSAFHVTGGPQRNWREVVLWLNLLGYPLPMIPFREWLAQLERESVAADHPLHLLRPFFLNRPQSAGGRTLPELHAEHAGQRIAADHSRQRLAALGMSTPGLNVTLLDRCLESLEERKLLPPRRKVAAHGQPRFSTSDPVAHSWQGLLTGVLQQYERDPTLTIRSMKPLGTAGEHSIASELTAWRYGTRAGLYRFRVATESQRVKLETTRELFIKAKPADREVQEVMASVATMASVEAGQAFAEFADRLGAKDCHRRELELYRQTDHRWRRHVPQVYGIVQEESSRQWVLVLENLEHCELLNSVDDPQSWTAEHITAAVCGVAELHAVWFGNELKLQSQPWLGPMLKSADLIEMQSWWQALHRHAGRYFADWLSAPSLAKVERLWSNVGDWWQRQETLPQTLIHNDFNPRNIAFRREACGLRLCAYDWELACCGLPQRDLAELLCFVLPPDAAASEAPRYIEMHRRALEQATGQSLDPDAWRDGFQLALGDFMLQRLPLYTLIHPFRPQRFLERTARTWDALAR